MIFYFLGLWEFNFGASLSEGVVGQGCDRAWRVECIMELKKIAGSPILDNENAVFFFQNLKPSVLLCFPQSFVYPRKLDYLKSGFGKIVFCSFTLISSIIDFLFFGDVGI